MRQLPAGPDPQQEEDWLCSWCYAVTTVGPDPQEVSRPPYLPVDLRWERAAAEGLASDISHAYGYFGATLCSIQRDDMSASPYPWTPAWANACQDCKEAAAVIDQRWPVEKREGNRVQSAPLDDSDWSPF